MNKRFIIWDNPKDAIITLTIILMIIGCINVFSASFVRAEAMFNDGKFFLKRYAAYAAIGLSLMWFIGWKINYKYLLSSRFCNLLYGIVFVALLALDVVGVVVNGSRRWFYLAGISVQPSEIAKVVIIMYASSYLGMRIKKGIEISLWGPKTRLGVILAFGYSFLIFKQPDLGTAAIVFALMLGMYLVAGISKQQVLVLVAGGMAMAGVLAIAAPYRLQRIMLWLQQGGDERGGGYQMAQSLLAIGSGGIVGTPWGQGTSKFFYLPEAHTDFAFANFCQEWGFLGALALVGTFTIFALALFRIAMSTKDERGFLLVSGATFLLIGQAVANMAMVCGLLPVIGVPLTFISYGGTSMIMNLVSLGLVISVYHQEAKEELKQERVAQGKPAVERNGVRVVRPSENRRGFNEWPR